MGHFSVLAALLYGLLVLGSTGAPVVTDGKWRFSALTDRLIRIEYDEAGLFVDDPTDAFPKDGKPRGSWESAPQPLGNRSVLRTGSVILEYLPQAPTNGSVVMTSRKDSSVIWRWGDDVSLGNLRGTARTLDGNAETLDLNCHNKVSKAMANHETHCTWGLISLRGWALVNETGMPVWKNGWYAPSRNTTDVYVFLHGSDYSGALKDFIDTAGVPGLPPRYALGSMFTRWYNFDEDSVAAMVSDFEDHSMPLDAWIFDMNWHIYGPWGAMTWNSESYPRLQETLDFIKSKGLPIGVNTHEHDGIRTTEQTFQQVCAALGRRPEDGDIPFDLYNKSYAMAQEDIAWRALQTKGGTQGVDFAWIDYQQGETSTFENTTIPGLNPTIVLNRLRSTNAARHGENLRPLIVSRWGGLGSHKYAVGFSGDQLHSWKGLAFLPYFTSTAANVAFGFWSHDTVGGDHKTGNDYELSVRWFQVSAWSPVLRMHDKGAGTGTCATDNTCAKIVPWDVPARFYRAIREAAWRRDELLPYIYTAAFRSISTGLALVRPMYYEDPSDPALYHQPQQYLFGPDMIVSPITEPMESLTGDPAPLGTIRQEMYVPKGPWVDALNGDFPVGQVTSIYGIRDVPSLTRQGAVIPQRPRLAGEGSLARARQNLYALELRIAPAKAFYLGGAFAGSGVVVDDDGLTMDYQQGKFATTNCSYSFKNRSFSIRVERNGSFDGEPDKVTLMISFPQMAPLKLAGTNPPFVNISYDHRIIGPVITLKDVSLASGSLSLNLDIDEAYTPELLPNLVGLLGRTRRARYAKDALDELNIPYGSSRANITALALTATHMSPSFLSTVEQLWRDAAAQASALVATEKGLLGDPRRSALILSMMKEGTLPQAAKAIPQLVV